jgi:hypothetical protein
LTHPALEGKEGEVVVKVMGDIVKEVLKGREER